MDIRQETLLKIINKNHNNDGKFIVIDSLNGYGEIKNNNFVQKNSKRRKQRQRGKLKQIKFSQELLTPLINFWKNQDEIYKYIRENPLVCVQPLK